MEIRKEYFNYLNKELGFSKDRIMEAWKLAHKDFPNRNELTLEVMTRDILRDRKSYEDIKKRMNIGVIP